MTTTAWAIPTKSCMHDAKNNKARTPTRNQMITIAPSVSKTEHMLREVFWYKYKPSEQAENVQSAG